MDAMKRQEVEVEEEEEDIVVDFNDKEEEEAIDDEVEEEEEEEEEDCDDGYMPSPLMPLKFQIEKDKEDESLRKWKEELLGDIEGEIDSEIEPEVTFHSIGVISDGYEEIVIQLPVEENKNPVHFTLKEGANYRMKLKFSVHHNIVSGLTYRNTVRKGRLKVQKERGMLGTFAPHRTPYEEMLDVETAPSGFLARGIYSAKLEFGDDDHNRYLDLNYKFQIKKH